MKYNSPDGVVFQDDGGESIGLGWNRVFDAGKNDRGTSSQSRAVVMD